MCTLQPYRLSTHALVAMLVLRTEVVVRFHIDNSPLLPLFLSQTCALFRFLFDKLLRTSMQTDHQQYQDEEL